MTSTADGPPLNLLFVTPRFRPLTGGVETHVEQVSRRLAGAGVAVTVLTTAIPGTAPAVEHWEAVTVHRVRAFFRRRQYYLAPDMYRIIRSGSWDLVHCQSYQTLVAPLGMLAARLAQIPYVVTFHGGGHSSLWRNHIRPIQLRALQPLLSRASKLIAIARFEVPHYGKLLGLPASRFVCIPNGCDLPPAPRSPASPTGDALVISIGRLERYKRHHRVIAAFPQVLERWPSARLLVLGTGPYEGHLRRLVTRLRLVDRVEIRGIPSSDREGMAATLGRAALVMLLSEYETQPVALLEALSLGRPVLVADTSGMRELAERGLARRIALDSTPEQIADAILAQLAHPLRPDYVSLPTWDDCTSALLGLYRSITAGRERRAHS